MNSKSSWLPLCVLLLSTLGRAAGQPEGVVPVSRGPANWAGAASHEIYDLVAVDQPPRVIDQPAPHYPLGGELPRTVGGSTLVDFVVDTQGRVHNAFAVTSTQKQFGDAAVRAVSRWIFQPGRKGGVPVNVHLEQRMDYVAMVRVTAWGDLQNIRASSGRPGATPSPGPIRINR